MLRRLTKNEHGCMLIMETTPETRWDLHWRGTDGLAGVEHYEHTDTVALMMRMQTVMMTMMMMMTGRHTVMMVMLKLKLHDDEDDEKEEYDYDHDVGG